MHQIQAGIFSIFGNTVAFAGAENEEPGSGLRVAGAGRDALSDLPPQADTAKRKDEQRRRVVIFNCKVNSRNMSINISEDQLWLNENRTLIPLY